MPKNLFAEQMMFQDEPRDLFEENNINTKGFSGIGQDIAESFESLGPAILEMLSALPHEFTESGKQIFTKPTRAASNIAGGALSGLRFAGNIPHNSREYLLEKGIPLTTDNPYPKFESSSLENYLLSGNEEGDALLRGAGEFFVPFSGVGKGLKGVKGLGARSGAVGGLAIGSDEMNPIHAAFMGMLGEGAGNIVKKGSQSVLNKTPFGNKNEVAIKGIEPGDVAETVQAARRLGLDYITPGEASGFGYIGTQEGKIGNTLEGSKLREKRAKERAVSEEAAVDKFLNGLADESLSDEKRAFYESSLSESVPWEFIEDFVRNSETVKRAIDLSEKTPEYKDMLKGVKRNSLGYWDVIKGVLDDMYEKAENNSPKLARTIYLTTQNLLKELDSIAPDYPKARALSQREIVRRKIEKKFDKRDKSGKNFYEQVLKSKAGFKELYVMLDEFPELQQQMRDMKLVFDNLFGTRNAKATVHGERTHVGTARSGPRWIYDFIRQKMNETGDVNAVKQLTSEDWYDRMRGNPNGLPPSLSPEVLNKFTEYLIKSMHNEQDGEANR